MTFRFDLAVLIGRFQPFHKGHLQIVRSALKDADNVLILIGSANIGRDTRNPFTLAERTIVTANNLSDEFGSDFERIRVRSLDDNPYDNAAWIVQVQERVAETATKELGLPLDAKIAITGHDRDQSSFYLKKFPQWTFLPPKTDLLHINATALRHAYLVHGVDTEVCGEFAWLTRASFDFLSAFARTEAFKALHEAYAFEINYRKTWGPGPHQTVDNIVVKSGHLLVVERRNEPGKGLLAIPGGFLERTETTDEGAVRELFEETKLDFFNDGSEPDFNTMKQALWPHFRGSRRFDAVNRSTIARIITEAYLFKLPDDMPFPQAIGSDDAAKAFWLPLSEVKPEKFFCDHAFIVNKMLQNL